MNTDIMYLRGNKINIMINKIFNSKKWVLFSLLLFFTCLSMNAQQDVDAKTRWGSTSEYTRDIKERSSRRDSLITYHCINREGGGLTIIGLDIWFTPKEGMLIQIPENFGGTPVYAVRRFGEVNNRKKNGQNYRADPMRCTKTLTNFKLSLPGTLKEVAPFIARPTIETPSETISNTALTELIIRPTDSNPDLLIDSDAFADCTKLTKVTLGRGVREIGEWAFRNVPITTISDLPEGLQVINGYAFNTLFVTRNLHLPNTLTMLGDFAFAPARSEKYGWFFENDLVIPSSLKYIGASVFSGSRKVGMKLVIPEGVERINGLAFASSLISEVTFPSTLKVLEGGSFREQIMLEKVTFKANSVLTTLETNIFSNCPNLRYIDMSKVTSTAFTMSGLTREVGKTFGNLNPYTIVYLPKSQTASNVVVNGQENFVQYNGSEWRCANFVVYDYHAAYDLQNIRFTTEFGTDDKRYTPATMSTAALTTFNNWKSSFPAKRGCDYELPLAFVADNAIFKRSFSATPTNQMLVTGSLPYSTTTAQAGIKCYKLVSEIDLTGSYKNKGLYFISLDDSRLAASSLTTEEQRGCITANNPYVMQVTDASRLSVTSSLTVPATTTTTAATTTAYHHLFASVNAKVVANSPTLYTTIAPGDGTSTWQFVGHPMNISNADAAANKLYTFNSKTRKWHPVKTGTANGYVHSFRAVMKYTGSDASYAKSFPLFLEADETTGISNIEATEGVTGKATVYTIDGRYVGTSLDALPKGIYVVDGKKVVKQ